MDNKKAVIYCRVSTKEQVEEGNSLTTQERICKEYAFKNSYEVIHVFIEQGESAKTTDRAELNKLLTYCKENKGRVHAVIAYKLDRISRNLLDYTQIKFLLKGYGVDIKSTTEHFEDNPAGRFMENIIANVAQFDNDVRTERSMGGMRDAMREGRYVWMAPIGYSNVKIGGKSTIVPNEMAPLIRKAFVLVAKNLMPTEEIRRLITKDGLRSRTNRPVVRSQFYTLFTNELYKGWMTKFGERHKGLYEPIVSEELFDLANRALKKRTRHSLTYLRDHPDFPLRRFVKHSSGLTLTGFWAKGRNKMYAYYSFMRTGLSYPKAELEKEFKLFMEQYTFNETLYDKLKKAVEKNLIKATAEKQKEGEMLKKHIVELEQKQSILLQKNIEGVINDAVLQRELARIQDTILSEQAALVLYPDVKTTVMEALLFLKDFLLNPFLIWENAKPELRAKLQWFEFPKGITFDGLNFQTAEVCSIFRVKDLFLTDNSIQVHSIVKNSNFTPEADNSPGSSVHNTTEEDQAFWRKFAFELDRLVEILKEDTIDS